ncbi:MAG: hypothetical protein LBR69_01595, partial [Endomicrobium sp.]|nr:hypothetical protein [Endomicrobium sp.]
MERTKGLLVGRVSNPFSLSSIKKALVLFVLCSMLVNGFAYGATETRRNGLVVVAVSLACKTINRMFSKCNVSLMAMTNKLSEEISVIIKKALGMESGEFSGGR